MNIEITPLFLVLAAVIGLLVGLLVASLFSSRESKSTAEKTPPAELAKDGFAEVARLWYSPSGKKIITELDGEFYHEFLTLSPDQKKRVLRTLTIWSNWAGKGQAAPLETAEATQTSGQEVKPMVFEGFPASSVFSGQPVSEVVNSSPAFVKTDSADTIAATVQLVPLEPEKPKTIAGQISLIIDQMLEGNPLKAKGIKLIENAHQGVDVWIGLEKFDGIDAIPYPEAQQLIKAAVSQWEREADLERKLSGKI